MAHFLKFKGLIVLLDEAEKYFQLRGYDKDCGKNLLGGLIWAATAKNGQRGRRLEPNGLFHSGGLTCLSDTNDSQGIPFTTEDVAHLGVAIAMTPGHEQQPEQILEHFGFVSVVDMPVLTKERLFEYCFLVSQYYSAAFALRPPDENGLRSIADDAVQRWQTGGNLNARSGVQAAIAAFDQWRDRMKRPHIMEPETWIPTMT